MKLYNLTFEDGQKFTNINKIEMNKIIIQNENLRVYIEDVVGNYIPNKEDMENSIRDSRKQFFKDAYNS